MYCPVCASDFPEDWKACPKDATALLRSNRIGKYTIEGLLGIGGMGAVYRAVNPDTKGKVALKIMRPEVASAESARARFQREAAAVAALRTSHVVQVFDFGSEDDGTLYLVMELLEGHSLRAEIRPEHMHLARVQMVLDGALRGLAAAHKAGIVHRDLKPENIFIAETDDGEIPKLLDFGIARVRTKDSDLTRTGSLMGTAGYMAIEQVAADAGEVGPWTDVYAMGAILYEMLAGAPACGGDTVTAVLQKVLRHEITPLDEVRPGLPKSVYALVERCLDADAAKRPQDAEQLRAAIAQARLVATGAAVPPAQLRVADGKLALLATVPSASSQTAPAIPPPQPRSKLPMIGAIVAIAAGGLVAMRVLGGHHEQTAIDAGVIVPPAPAIDAMPIDAAIDAAIDASTVTAGMVHLAAGTHELGEKQRAYLDSLPATTVTLPELWVDPTEMTLAELRAALKDPKAGGKPWDTEQMPARNVSWARAAAACAALGKRLPHEVEWETAALTTPQDVALATLKPAALAPSPHRECSADGLCDMLGSVLEWTADDWPERAGKKIVRGGSFLVARTAGWQASIHARAAADADKGDAEVGVRCVVGAEP